MHYFSFNCLCINHCIGEKIQKRINKKYFLPFRRVENNYTTKINFETVNLSEKTKENPLTLNDFMYDIY